MSRKHVSLLVETSTIFGREILRGISRFLVENEQWSIYLDLRELMSETPTWLENWKGDGIISRVTTPTLAEMLRAKNIPVVDLTDIYGDMGLPHIWSNHHNISALAAGHLLERGFRNFAFFGYSDHEWSRQRRDGFLRVLKERGLKSAVLDTPYTAGRTESFEQQQDQVVAWLQTLPRPLGVMAANDQRGLQILDACRTLNVAVPEDIAVIGVDNEELLCQLADPPLSTVTPNPFRTGYEAAALLAKLMAGAAAPDEPLLIDPTGVVTRQSTDVLAIEDQDVASALRFIRQYACQGITISDVLKHVPVSRSVLERRFRKYFNRSPQAELRNARVKRVKQLLGETDFTLDQIAGLAGFEHPEYMSVVFKRETGLTPGEFRRQIQPRTRSV